MAHFRARTDGVGDLSLSSREETALDGPAPLLLSLVEVAATLELGPEDESSI